MVHPTVSLAALPMAARSPLVLLGSLLPRREQAWLVGGALRDILLGRTPPDVDVTVASGSLQLGRALADRLGAPYVVLDEDRGACRILGERAGGVRIDLTDLRAPTIEGDLGARDVTINALAVPLQGILGGPPAPVLDPTGGLRDLERRAVRLCSPTALSDDPVRALRAVRFASEPGWALDPGTEAAVREAAPAVTAVAAERLRDELVALLGLGWAGAGLRALDALGVLPVLLPESGPMRETSQPEPHRFDVWEHSLRAVDGADLLLHGLERLEPWGAGLAPHLDEELGDGLTRREALKLAALLHDVSKPETRAIIGGRVRFLGHDAAGAERARDVARRFRLSGRAETVLARLVRHHLRPMHLAQAGLVTRRARYRFVRDLGDEARDLLLLALADAAAVRGVSPWQVWEGAGSRTLRELLRGIPEERARATAAPFLRGEDVMATLGIGPGPAVGRFLARARQAQALGLVRSRDEALAWLRRLGASLDTSGEGS